MVHVTACPEPAAATRYLDIARLHPLPGSVRGTGVSRAGSNRPQAPDRAVPHGLDPAAKLPAEETPSGCGRSADGTEWSPTHTRRRPASAGCTAARTPADSSPVCKRLAAIFVLWPG